MPAVVVRFQASPPVVGGGFDGNPERPCAGDFRVWSVEEKVMKRSLSLGQCLVPALILASGSLAFVWGQTEPAKGAAAQAQKGQASGAVFKGTADLAGAVQIRTDFSPDKQATTVTFRNLVVSIPDVPPPPAGTPPDVAAARIAGMPGIDTRTATVVLPIEARNKPTPLTQYVRGHIDVSDYAQAVLIVRAAGKTTVVDLKAAAKEGDYRQRIDGSLPVGAIYQATLTLMLERVHGDPTRGGQLTVDSFDVELATP
jgi:hypothetical protein